MAAAFVIMPYGSKVIVQSGATIDFDVVYRQFILPACDAQGAECRRMDEVSLSGPISRQIVKFLASAEIAIADLTTANPNVYFELGIRQSLTERPTILIASQGTPLPFDVHDQRVVFYGYPNAPFAEKEFSALSQVLQNANVDGARSPILSHLRELGTLPSPLNRSSFEADLRQKIARASGLEQLLAVWNWAAEQSPLPPYVLIDLADRISAYGDWACAVKIGARAITEKRDDFELHRRYGWYLRNEGPQKRSCGMVTLNSR
jgi:hypothetical protein